MKIALIGYGKMGKTIEKIAHERGHETAKIFDLDNIQELKTADSSKIDVAIEFTQPSSAFENIKICLENKIPIVSGTTGWLDKRATIEALCEKQQGAFFYASNFSVGVNIFFQLNQFLAKMMSETQGYDTEIEEVHHTEKKDAPSGTALTIAEGMRLFLKYKTSWVNQKSSKPEELSIISKREDNVPGTHQVRYHSEIDDIEIKHTAHSRLGFATGAVLAAEWLKDKTGVFGMEDLLGFES